MPDVVGVRAADYGERRSPCAVPGCGERVIRRCRLSDGDVLFVCARHYGEACCALRALLGKIAGLPRPSHRPRWYRRWARSG